VGCKTDNSLSSIKEFVCANERLRTLCRTLQEAQLDELLNDVGTFTLFAPTDSAFDRLGEAKVRELLDDPTGALRNVLLYHVSNKIFFSRALKCEEKIDTELGDGSDDFTTTRCEEDGRVKYQVGNGNDNYDFWPRIAEFDVVTCNGVVHLVNNVILPIPSVTSPSQ